MTLAIKTWKNINFFSSYGFYDKIIQTLKIINRGEGIDKVNSYFKIEEPDGYADARDIEKNLLIKLFHEALNFIEFKEDSIELTEEGNTIINNHKAGEINYNKQLVFLYIARNTGGFLNIFYSLREGARIDRETITTRVNQEREEAGFPARKRWRDFQERLEWFKELGIIREFEDGTYMLTYTGKQLYQRMQKKKDGESAGKEGKEDPQRTEDKVVEKKTVPLTTINQLPEEHRDVTTGKIRQRRFGIRIDDDIIVYVVGGDTLRVIEGKVLQHKSGLHLVDTDGYYHRISYDWVTDIVITRHNRPHPKDDKEAAAKRRRKTKQAKPKEPDNLDTAYI